MLNIEKKYNEKWICPHCGNEGEFAIIEDKVTKVVLREFLLECENCGKLHIRQYEYVKSVKLDREKF